MELNVLKSIEDKLDSWETDGEQPIYFTVAYDTHDNPRDFNVYNLNARKTGAKALRDIISKVEQIVNSRCIKITYYRTGRSRDVLGSDIFPLKNYKMESISIIDKPEVTKQPAVSQPNPSPIQGMDFIGAILGMNSSLNGADALNGILEFRDKQIMAKFESQDKDKTIAQLQLENKLLAEKLQESERKYNELDEENESLLGDLDELVATNATLQKYIPENSRLGVSMVQVGSSILNGVLKGVIHRNPEVVAKLFGTDAQTLKGMFDGTPQATPQPVIESPAVSVSLAEDDTNLSPERKKEIQGIQEVDDWLKSLDSKTLGMVFGLIYLWNKDIKTLTLHYNWATGTTGSVDEDEK